MAVTKKISATSGIFIALAIVVTILVVGTVPSGYFLHLDTSNQSVAALSILRGCFEYSTEKMWTVFLLATTYGIFGAHPQLEIGLHLLNTLASCALIYKLTQHYTHNAWSSALAIFICLALPAFQYFTRTYWSYAIPLLLFTIWLAVQRRYVWCAFVTGLTLLAHFSSLVPLGLLWLYLAWQLLATGKWRVLLAAIGAVLAPIVIVELVFLAYYGPDQPLLWSKGVLNALTNHSDVAYNPNVWWFLTGILGSNGWTAIFLGFAVFGVWDAYTQLSLRPLVCVGLGTALFYWGQGALGRGTLFTKAFTLLYPIWAIMAAVGITTLLQTIRPRAQKTGLQALTVIVVIVSLTTALFIRSFTATPQLIRAEAYTIAKDTQQPVLAIWGSTIYTPAFYALANGVETIYGTPPNVWEPIIQSTQPIIVNSGASLQSKLDPTDYTLHASYGAETPPDTRYPTLREESGLDFTVEVWVPNLPTTKHFQIDNAKILPPANLYAGTGCLSNKPFGNGSKFFYQLVLDKLF